MSAFQENSALFSPEDTSLLNLTVSDFLRDVCTKCAGDNDKTVDHFIEMLIQLLFKFADLIPLYKMQLNRIIRVLVDYGVQYRTNLNSSHRDYNKSDVCKLKTFSRTDCLKQAYTMLYDLDKKINELQDIKLQIYSELFNKESKQKDINIKMEVVDDPINEEETSIKKTVDAEVFHPAAVRILAQVVKDGGTGKIIDSPHSSNHMMATPLKNNSQEKFKETSNKKSLVATTTSNLVQNNIENKLLKDSVSMRNLSSPIISLKVYEDNCIAGCENGQLQIFSLESGNLIDNIQAHSMPLTSLVIWDDRVVTCSLDKSLKSFNLKKNSIKQVTIEHPIETTTDDLNGVLYAGTSSGKIFRFNILSMTQIGLAFHVSSTRILCMKVFCDGFRLLVAVSAENKPIAIRSADKGTLLKTLQVDNIISFDISMQDKLWYGVSKDNIYAMSLHKSEAIKNISRSNLSRVCIYGNLLVVCESKGNLYIYDKELVLQRILSVDLVDDITAVAIWKNFVAISYRHIGVLKLLNLHQN